MKSKNNKLINLFLVIYFSIVLSGCGSPCRTEANEQAVKIIKSELKNTENRQMFSCGFVTDFEEYILDMYGYNDDELEQIMRNISKVSQISGVNMKISIYRTPLYFARSQDNPYISVVKPNEKPLLTIKIKNKGEQNAKSYDLY